MMVVLGEKLKVLAEKLDMELIVAFEFLELCWE